MVDGSENARSNIPTDEHFKKDIMMSPTIGRILLLSVALIWSPPASARLARIIIETTAPATTAGYEIVSGRFIGELDPHDQYNSIITDITSAPRNARGKVEYSATFRLARPLDPAKRSGVLMYDVPNRGNVITGFLRGGTGIDPAGHIWVVSGWQGDIAPSKYAQSATVPIAIGPTGKPITGPVVARLVNLVSDSKSVPVAAGATRPTPVSLDTAKAQLWREEISGIRTAVPSKAWAFADCRTTPFPGTPDARQLCLRDRVDADAAYTLVYEGKDPPVLGIGFAATRDLVSFLRSGKPDDMGTLNPAGLGIRWTIGTGRSQSGNFLRSFVHLGFNADEAGARVFDGMDVQIAARQVPLNVRFGVPGGTAGVYEAGSEGTVWWGRYDDRVRRQGRSSLLDRCTTSRTCPKVVETLGSAEFWGLRLSPDFVGTDARADIPLPADVRRYYFPSTAHGGGFGKGFVPAGDPRPMSCVLSGNPNLTEPTERIVQKALLDWVVQGREPPASRYPTLTAGDLVPAKAQAMGWPAIPGAPTPDGKINPFVDQDFGPALRVKDLSGVIATQPPRIRRILPSLVPRLDADGNETAGIPSVYLQTPIGTYLGWNVESKGFDRGKGCGFAAGFIPFAQTRGQRLANGDPRLSLEERYGDHAGFVARVREVARREVNRGWLLPEDAKRIITDADASAVLR
ncbi:MAG TPA: alpha/beta hydrolase domain-containing protein [Sphingobium sp.]|uniref:alpha/beta hydrolase domain-containing protein n=1 Tax=Sphingobium sp. TaxID=1912891 RepID=UPI002ED29D04